MSRPRLSLAAALRRLPHDREGGASVEFVVSAVGLIGLLIFAINTGAAHFLQSAATDAARRAARLAATQPVAHCEALRGEDGMRLHALAASFPTMPATSSARACLNAPSPCEATPQTWSCSLGEGMAEIDPRCDAELMEALWEAADGPGVHLQSLAVDFRDSRLGEAGGPVIPLISVTLQAEAPALRSLLLPGARSLAPVTATAVGEMLDRDGAEGPQC